MIIGNNRSTRKPMSAHLYQSFTIDFEIVDACNSKHPTWEPEEWEVMRPKQFGERCFLAWNCRWNGQIASGYSPVITPEWIQDACTIATEIACQMIQNEKLKAEQ